MPDTFLITATGTEVGKTFLTRALTASLIARGRPTVAIKPVETGCDPDPLDAIALARACGQDHLVVADGLFRAVPPLAPLAIAMQTGLTGPEAAPLAQSIRALCKPGDCCLVEGAGGLLVPLNAEQDFSDLALALHATLILVAPDSLGVLSHVLTAVESARSRALPLLAVVLVQQANPDASSHTNAAILEQRLNTPILRFAHCADDDAALATESERCGLSDLVATSLSTVGA